MGQREPDSLKKSTCTTGKRNQERLIHGQKQENTFRAFDAESIYPLRLDRHMEAINISEGTVGSRFVTQDEIESARARKDEQWKAAYARHAHIFPPP